MNILRKTILSTVAIIGLTLTSTTMASANEPTTLNLPTISHEMPELLTVVKSDNITASASTKISFDTPVISSKPAPKPAPAVEPVALAQDIVPIESQAKPEITTPSPVSEPIAQAPAPVAVPVVPPEPAPVAPKARASSGVGAALVASAYSQLGVAQDCTRMVENALGSIGIITGDIGPSNFFAYGSIVSDPQPGDLMIQGNSHVAIYVGNGMAISGGYNGQNTVLHQASLLVGASYVRVE